MTGQLPVSLLQQLILKSTAFCDDIYVNTKIVNYVRTCYIYSAMSIRNDLIWNLAMLRMLDGNVF